MSYEDNDFTLELPEEGETEGEEEKLEEESPEEGEEEIE